MSDFKGRHFRGEIVLWAVRWYCRYPISYRDLEAMMTERGVAVDHSTIYRWVQRFAPEMEKRLRRQWRRPQSRSWRVDETYIKVRGKWAYDNHEEIDRRQAIGVICKVCPPRLRWRRWVTDHVFRDGGLGDGKAKLQKLAMDPRCAPPSLLSG